MLTRPCRISQHPLLPAEFSSEVNKWGLVTTVHTAVHLFMLMWANLISSSSLGMKAIQSDLLAPTVCTACMNFELLGVTAEDSECQHWAVELSLGHTQKHTGPNTKKCQVMLFFSPDLQCVWFVKQQIFSQLTAAWQHGPAWDEPEILFTNETGLYGAVHKPLKVLTKSSN